MGPKLVVVAPTRELAQQIHEEVLKLNYSDIKRQGNYLNC